MIQQVATSTSELNRAVKWEPIKANFVYVQHPLE